MGGKLSAEELSKRHVVIIGGGFGGLEAAKALRKAGVRITLLGEPVRAIAAGHAFTIRAGCDKRIATCAAKFANAVNFRGFPTIPGQDAVLRYAVRDGSNQGAVL